MFNMIHSQVSAHLIHCDPQYYSIKNVNCEMFKKTEQMKLRLLVGV